MEESTDSVSGRFPILMVPRRGEGGFQIRECPLVVVRAEQSEFPKFFVLHHAPLPSSKSASSSSAMRSTACQVSHFG